MVDIPLYTESKITRKQAIREIADVILHSNMKPRMVKYSLQLLQKLLPVDNTLPTTIDELFGAMMSCKFKKIRKNFFYFVFYSGK
jgi:hypothetical protein